MCKDNLARTAHLVDLNGVLQCLPAAYKSPQTSCYKEAQYFQTVQTWEDWDLRPEIGNGVIQWMHPYTLRQLGPFQLGWASCTHDEQYGR